MAQHHTLSLLLSVYTIAFELFFFLSIFFPRTAPFFLANAFLFQLGLHVTAGHGFFQHMVLVLLLLVFLDPDWWRGWVNRYFGGFLSRWRPQEAL